jgi:DNA recombination protein RmuC
MNTETLLLILAALSLALLFGVGVLLWRLHRLAASAESSRGFMEGLRGELAGRIESLEKRNSELQGLVNQQLSSTQGLLQERLAAQESALRQQLAHQSTAMQNQTGLLQRHMEGTQTTLSQVTEKMGMVAQTTARMAELGRDIEELQRLLKSPKARGQLGELGLETLLGDMLPKDRVVYQHPFSDGSKVDAAVLLDRGLLPIDAKFPLEDFQRYLDAAPEDRPRARKTLCDNLKKKIDSVAQKYVRPGEGTLPLALMYLPAESLYYEAFIARERDEEDLWSYAYAKSVLPMSPGTLSAYLKTVALGLKAAAVERNARQVLELLATLERDLRGFRESYDTLGRHIVNAHQKYDENERALQRFEEHLERARDLGGEKEE